MPELEKAKFLLELENLRKSVEKGERDGYLIGTWTREPDKKKHPGQDVFSAWWMGVPVDGLIFIIGKVLDQTAPQIKGLRMKIEKEEDLR